MARIMKHKKARGDAYQSQTQDPIVLQTKQLAERLKNESQLTRDGIYTTIGGFFILCSISTMYVGFSNVYEATYLYWNQNKEDQAYNVVNFTMTVRGFVNQAAYLFLVALFIKMGERLCILIFTGLNCLGALMTIWTTNTWLYVLNTGVLQGIGGGTAYFIPVLIAWTYFPKKRGIITSLIMVGYSASSFILGNVIDEVANPNNEKAATEIPNGKGTLLIYSQDVSNNVPRMWQVIAGINFGFLLIGMIFLRKPNLPKNMKNINTKSMMGRVTPASQNDNEPDAFYEEPDRPSGDAIVEDKLIISYTMEGETDGNTDLGKPLVKTPTSGLGTPVVVSNEANGNGVPRAKQSNRVNTRSSRGAKLRSMARSKHSALGPSFSKKSMAISTRQFYKRALCSCDLLPLILIITLSVQFPSFFTTNFMNFATNYSISSEFASRCAAFASLFMVLGKLVIGPIYDVLGYRMGFIFILLVQMGVTVFTFFFGSHKLAFPVILFSTFLIYGADLNIYMIISQRLFGANHGPKAFSIMIFGLSFGSMIGGSFANVLLSIFGFHYVFIYFLVCTILSFFLFLAYRPNIKNFRDTFQENYDPRKE